LVFQESTGVVSGLNERWETKTLPSVSRAGSIPHKITRPYNYEQVVLQAAE